MEDETRRIRQTGVEHRVLARLASGEPVKVSTLRTATAATLPHLRHWFAASGLRAKPLRRNAMRAVPSASLFWFPKLVCQSSPTSSKRFWRSWRPTTVNLRWLSYGRGICHPRRYRPWSARPGAHRRAAGVFRLGGIGQAAKPFELSEPQTEALASIAGALGGFRPFLLHGVTGSGKTAVYLAAMQRALDRGLASILLVPEIGLTPQRAGLLDGLLDERVALLHSALTPEERSEQWRRIRSGDAPIVVGTRSAIFAPTPNLGLILVDEEHDQSYKQEETPRYNARDVAVMRAKLAGAVVVLGSATPSLETWQNSVQGKYARIEMRDRVMNRPLPEVELIDMRQRVSADGPGSAFLARVD